jgi:hypothetical protein
MTGYRDPVHTFSDDGHTIPRRQFPFILAVQMDRVHYPGYNYFVGLSIYSPGQNLASLGDLHLTRRGVQEWQSRTKKES